jgi:hypothetical protein
VPNERSAASLSRPAVARSTILTKNLVVDVSLNEIRAASAASFIASGAQTYSAMSRIGATAHVRWNQVCLEGS